MAKKLRVGDTIRGYRVTKTFGPGAMAISYAAQSADGRKIFLKQYKSPAPTVVWYGPFVDYQQEIASRVRGGKAAHYAVRLVDAFEERWGGPCYFQAIEFVENGSDLQQRFEEERETHRATGVSPLRDAGVWARHVTWAKVLMAAVAALHESKVVHADLKPPNVYLITDPSIGAGFQLKLIDMDFSLLADKRAPWHGHQGYVGSDNYRSPEHMARGGVPGLPSDVFTCGLILYELLAGVHPYWRDDQAEYAALARAHSAKPPTLAGTMPGPATNDEVSAALHRALSCSARVQLVAGDGRALQVGVRTEVGKHIVRQFGPDAEFWDARQVVLERGAAGWQATPVAGTPNETLLNGDVLAAPQLLREGDVLAVGRKAKGISKLPLTVRAG
jgi:serine/threonine protein kinase